MAAATDTTTMAMATTRWRRSRCGRESTVPATRHNANGRAAAPAAIRQPGFADRRVQLFAGPGDGAGERRGAQRRYCARVDTAPSARGGGAMGGAAVLALDAGFCGARRDGGGVVE